MKFFSKFAYGIALSGAVLSIGWFALKDFAPERAEVIEYRVAAAFDTVVGDIEVGEFQLPRAIKDLLGGLSSDPAKPASNSQGLNFVIHPEGVPGTNEPISILNHPGFEVGYSKYRGGAIWAAYHIFPVASLDSLPRTDWFAADGRVSLKIDENSYRHSGYDRGHLAPNFAISTRYGRDAQIDTFLMSNILPQKPSLNREVWKDAELHLAKVIGQRFETWVYVGPIYDRNRQWLNQSENGRLLEIPDAFYMIAIWYEDETPNGFALIMDQDVEGNEPLSEFRTTVDNIERLTDLDFFPEMEERLEHTFERRKGTYRL